MSSDSPHPVRAVIFDLDGVLVTTDELHFRAWKELADGEGIPFSRQDNERLRGVSRMESLEIVLERAPRRGAAAYTAARKADMAERKNTRYRELLATLGPGPGGGVLPGAVEVLRGLREIGVRTAVASSSRNAREIVRRCGLEPLLDAVVDGTDITRSKPDPQVFLLAAERLGLPVEACVVVEDAGAGVEAGLRGGFRVIGVGEPERVGKAARVVASLAGVSAAEVVGGW